ncbi:hypothetical protein SCHIN_v1c10070 [Spiroplasma chinense]|uniref:Transmembrane protein n=1 Tax=Spiroplasma chinense TaxID=216932 RepID=A0A5B9Y5H4_9MOLU|nr:hypothetical protein [Spiroplasma chinense]QEH62200.1 hypothetical protein SCHIN_v1c10070 [Spiroplasma chinense]
MPNIWNDHNKFIPDWSRMAIIAGCVLVTFVVLLATIINVSVYVKSKGRTSEINQRELFDKLQKNSGYNDITLHYGERRRFNNHFNYRAAYQELHLAEWYEKTNTSKGTMLMLYNFTNILDIRNQVSNFWSRSIYCHIFAAFGVFLNYGTLIAASIVSVGYQDKAHLAEIYASLCGLGVLNILVGWIWWTKLFNRLNSRIKELATPILTEAELKFIMEQFRLQALVPFTVNTSIRTHRPGRKQPKEKDSEPKIREINVTESISQ